MFCLLTILLPTASTQPAVDKLFVNQKVELMVQDQQEDTKAKQPSCFLRSTMKSVISAILFFVLNCMISLLHSNLLNMQKGQFKNEARLKNSILFLTYFVYFFSSFLITYAIFRDFAKEDQGKPIRKKVNWKWILFGSVISNVCVVFEVRSLFQLVFIIAKKYIVKQEKAENFSVTALILTHMGGSVLFMIVDVLATYLLFYLIKGRKNSKKRGLANKEEDIMLAHA